VIGLEIRETIAVPCCCCDFYFLGSSTSSSSLIKSPNPPWSISFAESGGGIILLSMILSPSPNPFGETDAPHHQSSSEHHHHKQPGLASQLPINIFSGLGIVWMVVRGTLTTSSEWNTIVLVHVCGQPYPKPLLEGGGCNS
jgi:hypothetical protein